MLKSEFTGEVMIFAKDYNGKTFYSLGLSQKKQDGTYLNGYMDCEFKKGVTIPNKTKINITKGWLKFYINKEKRTVVQVFISEFESDSQVIDDPDFQALEDDSFIPF